MRVGEIGGNSGEMFSDAGHVLSWQLGVPGGVSGVDSGLIASFKCGNDVTFGHGSGFTSLSSFLQRDRGGIPLRWDSKAFGQGEQFTAGEKSSSRVWNPSWKSMVSVKLEAQGAVVRMRLMSF